ncbi:MAG: DUF2721 domain-containing protein [Verrucomicrobiota bacterium]
MKIDITTPALLFPAISLLFLSYTNRFLHLAALIRQLHQDWIDRGGDHLKRQIENLRLRLRLIRWMQWLGAVSLLLCVTSMIAILLDAQVFATLNFGLALILMAFSLAALIYEIWHSGGALKILMEEVEKGS